MLVVIAIVTCAIEFFAPVLALVLLVATGAPVSFTTGVFLVIVTTALAAALIAALVAHRAHWRCGGIIARAIATGGCGLVFGLGWMALLWAYFG